MSDDVTAWEVVLEKDVTPRVTQPSVTSDKCHEENRQPDQ